MPPIYSEEKKLQIRTNLLNIGFHMMKTQGIKATNIEEIAQKVGIAKGTFYHFFASKQDFILQIIREYQNRKFSEFQNEVSKVDSVPIDGFLNWYSTMVNYEENPLYSITPQDAQWLREKLPKIAIYDEANDIRITKLLLSKVEGVSDKVDYAVVANFPKIIFLMVEHREELHSDALDQTLRLWFEMMKKYLMEGEK